MQAPMDYRLAITDPIEAASKGYALGASIRERQQQEQIQQAALQAQREQAAKEAKALAIADEERKRFFAIENPTFKDMSRYAASLPASQASAMLPYLQGVSRDQVNGHVSFGMKVLSSLNNKRPDIAKAALIERATAARVSGDERTASEYEAMASAAEKDPSTLTGYITSIVAALPGGADALKSQADAEEQYTMRDLRKKKAKADIDLVYATIANMKDKLAKGDDVNVQRSVVYKDGTTLIVTNKGGTAVIAPNGEAVSDPLKRQDVLQKGRMSGIEDDALGKATNFAQETARDAYKSAYALSKTSSLLNRAISLLETAGADTGKISNYLPTLRDATIELQNVQNELGLSVVGSVTFGALSEGELKLAQQVGFPSGLNEKNALEWAKAKLAATDKLKSYLEEQAMWLNDHPGSTVSGWLKYKRQAAPSGIQYEKSSMDNVGAQNAQPAPAKSPNPIQTVEGDF